MVSRPTAPKFTHDGFLAVLEQARDEFDPAHPERPRSLNEWIATFRPTLTAAGVEYSHLAIDPESEGDDA